MDALSLPFDITWQRIAWCRDMIHRSYTGTLPPKWRSSMAISIYAVPLADTAEEYPNHRIVYLKVSASLTGLSPGGEALEGHVVVDPSDVYQQEGWELIAQSASMTMAYWPCIGAIIQVGIYPRPEAGVADEDYPFIVDFEPKRRELYEAVSETGELLSGSQGNVNVRKGNTTTRSTQVSASMHGGTPMIGGSASVSRTWGSEDVDMTTTDASTERRETVGRTTQLSQMYQLFNGYHLGTNRSVFALFPRPHTVSSKGQQIEYNLIRGERQLEGVQDLFLVVQVPRSIPGICVRGYLDTAHKGYASDGMFAPVLVTRRTVGGGGEWNGDRFLLVAPPSEPPRMQVVGEYQVTVHDTREPPREFMPDTREPPREFMPGGTPATDSGTPPRMPMPGNDQIPTGAGAYWRQLKSGRDARIALADDLNKVMSDVQQALLANAAAGTFTPVDFAQSETFRTLVGAELRQSATPLVALEGQGYITAAEMRELASHGMTTVGALFTSSSKTRTATAVSQRLVEALGNPRSREARTAEQAARAGSGTPAWPTT